MKTALFSAAFVLALCGCGREEPVSQTKIDETAQVEKAADQAKPLSDTSLTQIVRTALESDSSIDARRIDVENRDGVVALHGRVQTEEQKEKAGRIVGSVGGVKTVDNRLTIDDTASTGATGSPGAAPELPKLPK